MKTHKIIAWLLFCGLLLLLYACSSPAESQGETFEVVERTRPANPPWQYTRTPDLSLTATATARESAITDYIYFESFDQNTYDWRVGATENPYWDGSIDIQNGTYTWQIDSVNETFMAWANFKAALDLQDFDVALRVRRVTGEPLQACFGMLFRISPEGIDEGTYLMSVCDNGYYKVMYYNAETHWDPIQDWTRTSAIYQDDWNLIEISARSSSFSVLINHQLVLTFSDSRLPRGEIAILVDYYTQTPGQIEFDFFALQPE